MRFLADENIPWNVIHGLRTMGHDVLSAKESLQGQIDKRILARAQQDHRTILTFDKDFGELAYGFGLPATSGIVLFRLLGSSPANDKLRALAVLATRNDWTGSLQRRNAPQPQDQEASQKTPSQDPA